MEMLRCQLCSQVGTDVVRCSNGHPFCRDCIVRHGEHVDPFPDVGTDDDTGEHLLGRPVVVRVLKRSSTSPSTDVLPVQLPIEQEQQLQQPTVQQPTTVPGAYAVLWVVSDSVAVEDGERNDNEIQLLKEATRDGMEKALTTMKSIRKGSTKGLKAAVSLYSCAGSNAQRLDDMDEIGFVPVFREVQVRTKNIRRGLVNLINNVDKLTEIIEFQVLLAVKQAKERIKWAARMAKKLTASRQEKAEGLATDVLKEIDNTERAASILGRRLSAVVKEALMVTKPPFIDDLLAITTRVGVNTVQLDDIEMESSVIVSQALLVRDTLSKLQKLVGQSDRDVRQMSAGVRNLVKLINGRGAQLPAIRFYNVIQKQCPRCSVDCSFLPREGDDAKVSNSPTVGTDYVGRGVSLGELAQARSPSHPQQQQQ